MKADISGPQRKVLASSVRPARPTQGEQGIPVRDGRTLPFVVRREWTAPAGMYVERFFIIDPKTREVFYEGPERHAEVRGLQALTPFVDEVREPVSLPPGSYAVVFALGGLLGGEVAAEAFEVSTEEAA